MGVLNFKKEVTLSEAMLWMTIPFVLPVILFTLRLPVVRAFVTPSTVESTQYEETGKVVDKNIVLDYRGNRSYLVSVKIDDENTIKLNGKKLYYKLSIDDEIALEKTVFENKKTNIVLEENYKLKK